MIDTKKTGQYIRNARISAGLSQSQLAERLCVSREAVSKWENGHHLPDVSVMEDLSDALSISIDELLSGEKHSDASEPVKTSRISRKYGIIILALIAAIVIGLLVMCCNVYTNYDSEKMAVWSEKVYAPDHYTGTGYIYLMRYDSQYIKFKDIETKTVRIPDSDISVLAVSLKASRLDILFENYKQEGFYIFDYRTNAEGEGYGYVLICACNLDKIPDSLSFAELEELTAKKGYELLNMQ